MDIGNTGCYLFLDVLSIIWRFKFKSYIIKKCVANPKPISGFFNTRKIFRPIQNMYVFDNQIFEERIFYTSPNSTTTYIPLQNLVTFQLHTEQSNNKNHWVSLTINGVESQKSY